MPDKDTNQILHEFMGRYWHGFEPYQAKPMKDDIDEAVAVCEKLVRDASLDTHERAAIRAVLDELRKTAEALKEIEEKADD